MLPGRLALLLLKYRRSLFLTLIDHDASTKVRAAAVGSLGSFKGYPVIFDKLVSLLPDPDLHVKVAAIAALGYWGDKRAIDPLQKMLKEASDTIRYTIEFALEKLMHEKGEVG